MSDFFKFSMICSCFYCLHPFYLFSEINVCVYIYIWFVFYIVSRIAWTITDTVVNKVFICKYCQCKFIFKQDFIEVLHWLLFIKTALVKIYYQCLFLYIYFCCVIMLWSLSSVYAVDVVFRSITFVLVDRFFWIFNTRILN